MQSKEDIERHRRSEFREDLADAFSKGADVTARRIADVNGDQAFRRFTRTQKGKLMGWGGTRTWTEVPKFWHDVEATKLEDDL